MSSTRDRARSARATGVAKRGRRRAARFVLLGSLLTLASASCVGIALAAASDWTVVDEPTWSNAHTMRFQFAKANGNAPPRSAHPLGVWMPRTGQPAGRAKATITRTFEATEGEDATLAFFGNSNERGLHPQAEVALYVLCHVLPPGVSGPGPAPEWVKIGEQQVKPSSKPQTLTAKITGGECSDVVALGHSREVTGARIQILGATSKHDHEQRVIFLTRFQLGPKVDDNFAQP